MDEVANAIRKNKNLIQTTGGAVASIGLEQVGKNVAGSLITPATWAVNRAADGSKPDAVDVGVWLGGLVSAPAAIITGTMKALVDDDTARKLALVRSNEPLKYARTISPCSDFGFSSPSINAMTIASKGGTAWVSVVGLWVYIIDSRGNLVADYEPSTFVTMYRRCKPYRRRTNGGFDWEVIRR